MTPPNTRAAVSTSHSLPRALVSTSAMRRCILGAVARGGTVADLRGDAFGHGALEMARVVAEAGIETVVVDDQMVAADLDGLGIRASVHEHPDIDTALLYGLAGVDVIPPMRLIGRVLSTKSADPGDAVSYGYTYRFRARTTLALVTGGYAQGVVRALGNHADVEIEGVAHPIVGRVAMDVCVVDLQTESADTAAHLEGADAVFFGGNGPARPNLARWAEVTGMTTAELITVVGSKVVREWTN